MTIAVAGETALTSGGAVVLSEGAPREGFEMWLFGFQRGVTDASSCQLGRPA